MEFGQEDCFKSIVLNLYSFLKTLFAFIVFKQFVGLAAKQCSIVFFNTALKMYMYIYIFHITMVTSSKLFFMLSRKCNGC